MRYIELEFKYKADNVPLQEFKKLCEQSPHKFLVASGYDYFYENKSDPTSFCRHRVGPDANQLTFKKKTTDKNNYLRDEDNLDLSSKMSLSQVESLCQKFGYQYKDALFKNCFIYKYAKHIYVYYIVYDQSLKELGRFIEVELDEKHQWASDDEAWDTLTTLEAKLTPIGVTPQNRLKKSLFEMYIKDKK